MQARPLSGCDARTGRELKRDCQVLSFSTNRQIRERDEEEGRGNDLEGGRGCGRHSSSHYISFFRYTHGCKGE